MNNLELAAQIKRMFPHVDITTRYGNQIEIVTHTQTIVGLLMAIKSLKCEHLSNVTCVDWINKGQFYVTYNIWSYTHRVHLTIKVSINRDNPEIPSIMEVWPHAQVYEREVHEMFGVKFIGNPDLSPLFLHNWRDIPPLRKDFDTVEYSRRAYGEASEGGEK